MKYTELSEDLRNIIEVGVEGIVENHEYEWHSNHRGVAHLEQIIKDEEIEFEDGFAYVTIGVKGFALYDKGDYYTPASETCDLDYEVKAIAIDLYEGKEVVESVDVELDKEIKGHINW